MPKITDVTPLLVSWDTLVVITGTGFSTTSCENTVTIGGVACSVTSSSATSISCTLGKNSGLKADTLYNIEVTVDNIGYAVPTGSFPMQFQPVIVSISPQVGSTAGGSLVTISGDGFTQQTVFSLLNSTNNNNFGVNIAVESRNFTQIVFRTLADVESQTELSLEINGRSTICSSCSFNFSSSVAAQVTAVSPTTVNAPNTQMTLTGMNFGTDPTQLTVTIGKQSCVVDSCTDTSILCTLSGLDLGENHITVNSLSSGNALLDFTLIVNGVGTIQSILPASGSISGGTEVTISGNGFASGVLFSGDQFSCKSIKRLRINQVICMTDKVTAEVNSNLSARYFKIKILSFNNFFICSKYLC